jgi:hypothetical protein
MKEIEYTKEITIEYKPKISAKKILISISVGSSLGVLFSLIVLLVGGVTFTTFMFFGFGTFFILAFVYLRKEPELSEIFQKSGSDYIRNILFKR